MSRLAVGTSMHLDIVRTRFVPDSKSGPKLDAKLADRVPEIRKLLRTDLPVEQIARQLGCCAESLRYFIRRRNLCDVGARAKFIGRQKNIAREACR